MNKPRRTLMFPEKMRTGSSKSKKSTRGGLCLGKENKFYGSRPNILDGCKILHNSKNQRMQTEALTSRSITRRLSFSKNDVESSDKSPSSVSKIQENICNSPNKLINNCGDSDASMLIPLNPTSIMGGTPSPYSIDLFGRGQQKKGFPPIETCLKSSQYDNFANDGDIKIGLSDETKNMLKGMGINTSPDCDSVKKDCVEKVPVMTAEVKKVIVCVDNETQTTPQLQASIAAGNSSAVSDVLAMLKNIYVRQSKEREELNFRHAKEVEDALSCFTEMVQGDLKEENNLLYRKLSSEFAYGVPTGGILEDNIIGPDSRIETSSNLQVPPASVASAQQLIFQTNEKQFHAPTQDKQQPLDGINGNHPLQKSVISTESASCPSITINKSFQDSKNPTPDKNKMPGEWGKDSHLQIWRKQEVSLLETPNSVRCLVSDEIEDVSMCNTPTIRLNSLLQGMSIQGQQAMMETPVTRHLVKERILKGVESLFY